MSDTFDARRFYLDGIRDYPSGHTTEERNIDLVGQAYTAGLNARAGEDARRIVRLLRFALSHAMARGYDGGSHEGDRRALAKIMTEAEAFIDDAPTPTAVDGAVPPKPREVFAAYVFDRAYTWDEASGIHSAVCEVAALVRRGEAEAAHAAGELDDILARWRETAVPPKEDDRG